MIGTKNNILWKIIFFASIDFFFDSIRDLELAEKIWHKRITKLPNKAMFNINVL